MQLLSHRERDAALHRMANEGVDILVVGGGITGAGVALDAAARGYRVGLVEKSDFASGTSSKSTKLVHGGIRYLAQFDFALVRESLVERGLLMRNAPFLVQPVGFLLPLYAGAKRPMGMPIRPPFGLGMGLLLRAGLLAYDLMSGRLGIKRHRQISKATAARLYPCLNTDKLEAAFIYYDAQTDDSRLTATVIGTAAQHGALVANHAELKGFQQKRGRITAALVEDSVSGRSFTIPTGTVVNAGGPFAGRIEQLAGPSMIRIKPAKGVHLTVERQALKLGRGAIVLPETDDRRLLFLVPWGSHVTIGTTDTEGGDIDRPRADQDDVAYLLRHVNRYMRCNLQESDIISAWAGYRSLVTSRKSSKATSRLSRTHAVLDGPGGMVTIVGGKLTTYRRMAQDTIDHIARQQGKRVARATERLPLSGSEDWPSAHEDLNAAASRFQLKPDTVRRLAMYGSNSRVILDLLRATPDLAVRIVPCLPYIMAEVVYACRYEMALDLADLLERRLRISFEDRSHGVQVAPRVAALMAEELGWDETEAHRQVTSYRNLIAENFQRGASADKAERVGAHGR
ncbi:MAG TPA: glycerol-3-phosphate dehydrogenase/oxidase [Chloroflexia bacterium]|jgi:glycerol-3-phosphate dehydrogenase|nr:glycerol-3-phosphate dehydrogenase/oxidase [Chloroflexia bacterium]